MEEYLTEGNAWQMGECLEWGNAWFQDLSSLWKLSLQAPEQHLCRENDIILGHGHPWGTSAWITVVPAGLFNTLRVQAPSWEKNVQGRVGGARAGSSLWTCWVGRVAGRGSCRQLLLEAGLYNYLCLSLGSPREGDKQINCSLPKWKSSYTGTIFILIINRNIISDAKRIWNKYNPLQEFKI